MATTLKISELKVKKIIRRPTRQFDLSGMRIYNEFEYDLPYNASFRNNERQRIFAKIIDLLPFFLVFFFIFHQPGFYSILYSILYVIIFGTLTENNWGTTLGKKTFKIKVIDDRGNYPAILKSLCRNLLCLAAFKLLVNDYIPPLNEVLKIEHKEANFTIHMNNKVCRTYIVKESQLIQIKKLLTQKVA